MAPHDARFGWLEGERRATRSPTAGEPEANDRFAGAPVVSRLASNPRLQATIAKFVQRLAERLEELEASFEAGDLEELARLAHWLKGAAGTVGFDAFTAPAAELEVLVKERKEAEIESALRDLRSLAERIAQ